MDACEIVNFLATELFMQQVKFTLCIENSRFNLLDLSFQVL